MQNVMKENMKPNRYNKKLGITSLVNERAFSSVNRVVISRVGVTG